jgi:hypothetical protein
MFKYSMLKKKKNITLIYLISTGTVAL